MNLWPAEDLAGIRAGLESISLPLRERLLSAGEFGVGLWLPANVARSLATEQDKRDDLIAFLKAERLDAFTFNAFPFGDFHRAGMKANVFKPDWLDSKRARFTKDVSDFGQALAKAANWEAARHLSISTHSGLHMGGIDPARAEPLRQQVAENLVAMATGQSNRESVEVVIGIEPEPRSLAGDTRELLQLWSAIEAAEAGQAPGGMRLGTCLDACHSAIEFESTAGALARATAQGQTQRPLAKLQFSSALSLKHPSQDPEGYAALAALDEPVYLHQVTGRTQTGLLRADDLGELSDAPEQWLAQDELRCHFHVPVDLEQRGGLGTTSAYAGELLAKLLAAPELWGTTELHVEIETYTWSLGGFGRDIVDGIESEYRHVIPLIEAAGWQPVAPLR